jgi:3-methyladenine DNA glycosylase AlkD
MTVQEVMAQLEALGSAKVRELNVRNGAPDNHFGVKMGDIRTIAKAIKSDHALGLELWNTGNADAMIVATLVLKPKQLSSIELEQMVRSVTYAQLADTLITNVVKLHPEKETLRLQWMENEDAMLARVAWSLTTERICKSPGGLDIETLLDRIESELASAPAAAQWTMNFCLGEIGIRYPEHRDRVIRIGETVGLYKDWPLSKGCIPPYVPVWVRAIVERQ